MSRFVTVSSLRRVSGVQSPAMKISKGITALLIGALFLTGCGAAQTRQSTRSMAVSAASARQLSAPVPACTAGTKVAPGTWTRLAGSDGNQLLCNIDGHQLLLAVFTTSAAQRAADAIIKGIPLYAGDFYYAEGDDWVAMVNDFASPDVYRTIAQDVVAHLGGTVVHES